MPEENKNKWFDFALALLLTIPGLLVFQQSATSLVEQGAASGDAMSNSAMFPKIIATLLIGLGIMQAIKAWRRKDSDNSQSAMPERNRSILIIVFLAIYIISITWLGYHIVTPILCMSILLMFGVKPIIAAFVGVCMSFFVALFFETLLNVILPVGIFELTLPF
ncbi:MAG: hypothetical protein COC08_06930 [Maribacter sp.]|nr:MAG: hypothetical protein COC08_06930 [Maribacter sp.]